MKILGIDYGDARTGLSVSDATGMLAGSPSVIHEWNQGKLLDKLVAFITENKIEEIVLGHPKNMDGTVGERAKKCEALAADRPNAPVYQSSCGMSAAPRLQRIKFSWTGKKAKKHRQTVDAVAATLILQGYLDFKRMRG